MRNLKRVLSLALASTMLLGMMVVGAGAADEKKAAISDMDKVTNKTAVSLMVDLGIIAGKPDGTFAPAEEVDRATMARLITAIMMGDVDPGLFEGTVTDLKDIDNSWAKGYIKYCYANKIIAGDGIGSFFPTNKVTAAEASKMLLVAIGYDVTAQGYGGTSWTINVMRDAKTAGLLAGVTAKTNDPLTRDNAAQMLFNALTTPTITYKTQYDGGVAYKTDPSNKTNNIPNLTLGETQFNLKKIAPAVLAANEANSGSALKGKSTIGTTTLAISTKIEDIGKNVVYYTFDKDGKTANSSIATVDGKVKVVSVPTNLAVAPSAGEKSLATWLSDNGLTVSATTTKAYSNYFAGSDYANTSAAKAALVGLSDKQTAHVIDNDDDGVIDALVINALTVKVLTGDVKTTTSGTTTTVNVPGITTGYVNTANVSGYEGLVKGDVVFTMGINGNTVTYITKADSVTGKITGYSASKVLIDGTAYEISDLAAAAFDTVGEYTALAGANSGNTVQFWTDASGKLAYAKIATGETATTGAILLEVAANSTNFEGTTYQAKLLKMDGTTEIVDIAKIYDIDDSTKADKTSAYAASRGGTNAFSYAKLGNIDFVEYSTDEDGKYTLAVITDAAVSGKTTYKVDTTSLVGSSVITAGKANYAETLIGNANTLFITVEKDTANSKVTGFSVRTGIANAPSSTSATGTVLTANGNSSIVFLTGGVATSAGDGTFLYITTKQYNAKIYTSADKSYTMKAFVDGVEQDVVIKSSLITAPITAGGLYEVKMDGADVIGASVTTAAATGTGISQSGGVITVDTTGATPAYYTFTDDTKVYVLDGKGIATAITPADIVADSNDGIEVYGDSTKLIAKTIIITKSDLAYGTAVTAATYNFDSDATVTLDPTNNLDGTGKTALKITATVAKGYKATVTVTGNGVVATATSADAKGGSVVAAYTINAADLTNVDAVTVTIMATDGENEISTTYTVDLKA